MRTFPYPLGLVVLLASCATAPQPAPEAAPTPAEAPAVAASQPSAPATPAPATPAASQSGSGEKELPDVPSEADKARIAELTAQAAPLVDAFVNSEALLTRDSKRVLLVSNRDGL